MNNTRIIPRLDIKGPNVVKPVHTEALRIVGNPKKLVQRYYKEGADEVIYMDIVASLYRRNLDFDLLKSVSEGIFIPFTVGGGIRTIGDINNALRAGADKVAINTHAIKDPQFLKQAVKIFGAQCIVLSIEAKRRSKDMWECYTDGGREPSGIDVMDWAHKGIELGVGEILITSIDQDGTRRGYDLNLIQKITLNSPIPVIVHGGAGQLEDSKKAISVGADALCASSIFHYKEHSIKDLKKYLVKNKISVRI